MKNTFRATGLDITPEEFITLNLIPIEGIDQGRLVKKSLKDKTNITRLLTRMEKKDLVKRQAHHSNARQQIIVLTEEGSQMRQNLVRLMGEMMVTITNGITEEEAQATCQTLQKLSQNLSQF